MKSINASERLETPIFGQFTGLWSPIVARVIKLMESDLNSKPNNGYDSGINPQKQTVTGVS